MKDTMYAKIQTVPYNATVDLVGTAQVPAQATMVIH